MYRKLIEAYVPCTYQLKYLSKIDEKQKILIMTEFFTELLVKYTFYEEISMSTIDGALKMFIVIFKCHLLHIISLISPVEWYLSSFTSLLTNVSCQKSLAKCQISSIICEMSHVNCHPGKNLSPDESSDQSKHVMQA